MRQSLARLHPFIQRVRRTAARPGVRRGLRQGFGLVSILAVAYVVVAGVGRVDWAALNIDWRYIVLAWLATVATVGVGLLGWTWLARALLPTVPATTLAHIHIRSLLAKYLPGGVWNSASKLVMLRQIGIPAQHASLAVILELVLLLLTGVEAGLITVNTFPSALPWQVISPTVFALILAVITILCLLLPFIVLHLARRDQTTYGDLASKLLVAKLWLAELIYLLDWLCLCICFNLIVAAIMPLDIKTISIVTVATMLSFIISFVIIVIPNGIGLRELIYSVLMSKIMDAVVAVSLGFMFRLIIALAEASVVMVVSGVISLHKIGARRKKRALTPLEY